MFGVVARVSTPQSGRLHRFHTDVMGRVMGYCFPGRWLAFYFALGVDVVAAEAFLGCAFFRWAT